MKSYLLDRNIKLNYKTIEEAVKAIIEIYHNDDLCIGDILAYLVIFDTMENVIEISKKVKFIVDGEKYI